MTQRVEEHFKGTLRGQRLTAIRCEKIQECKAGVHKREATVKDVADLERILKRARTLLVVISTIVENMVEAAMETIDQ